jgi:carbon-monoxide dehydrogenase small subunit
MIEVELAVNGEREMVSVGATQTLLDALRMQLGLTGTKLGCNQGVCGSCTVLIDGKPARSCLILAVGCRGRAITTIEGIGTAAAPSAVQQAFIEAGAVQCGYCTPGMVLAAEALLRTTTKASVSEIREALSGNLCRCSGYTKIVDAVKLASERAAS